MPEREFVIIARALGEDPANNEITFEAFKKVVAQNPVRVLLDLQNAYPRGPQVKLLFERGETENVERFVGKQALLDNANNFRLQSVYIFGMKGNPAWEHLYTRDKKLRNIDECRRDFNL